MGGFFKHSVAYEIAEPYLGRELSHELEIEIPYGIVTNTKGIITDLVEVRECRGLNIPITHEIKESDHFSRLNRFLHRNRK